MSADKDYARLLQLGLPTLETSEIAAVLRKSTAAATMLMGRLAKAGLAKRLNRGRWLVTRDPVNRYRLVDSLTAPMPSYVSLQTALYLHGMIDQVPSVIYGVSLDRTQRVHTSLGVYSIHHIAAELFTGYETTSDGTRLATPEKALFDVAYLSGGRSRLFSDVPELELPKGFRKAHLRRWTAQIGASRRRSMTEARLERLLQRASQPREKRAQAKSRSATKRRSG